MQVPGTALRLSRLALGTMGFGDRLDARSASEQVDLAARAGINVVDTANSYGGGVSETMLGELLKGRREDFVVCTKVGNRHADSAGSPPLSRQAIQSSVRGSLSRLGIDHIDIYYLHLPDRTTPIHETLETMAGLVADGTIGSIGVSNYAAWQLADMRAIAEREGWPLPTVSQPMYNLVARRIEEEYVEYAATADLINLVYNPLSGGLLAGTHQLTDAPAEGRFGPSRTGAAYRERYWNQDTFAAVDALRQVADAAGMSLVALSLRWLLGRPATSAVLVGASSVRQLADNLAAAEGGPLADDVLEACDDVWATLRGAAPAYNR